MLLNHRHCPPLPLFYRFTDLSLYRFRGCGQKVARLVEGEPPAPPPFRVGDEVIWLKRLPGGEYVIPIAATILAFTAKRVKIAAEDTEVSREPVVRYVPHESLQHRSRSSKR